MRLAGWLVWLRHPRAGTEAWRLQRRLYWPDGERRLGTQAPWEDRPWGPGSLGFGR